MIAILGEYVFRRVPLLALSQLCGLYTAAEMPLSFSSHTSPRDVLIVVVDSRRLVKDSAKLRRRGVQGVATGVPFKLLMLPQAGVGAALRLKAKKQSNYSLHLHTINSNLLQARFLTQIRDFYPCRECMGSCNFPGLNKCDKYWKNIFYKMHLSTLDTSADSFMGLMHSPTTHPLISSDELLYWQVCDQHLQFSLLINWKSQFPVASMRQGKRGIRPMV